MIELRGLTKKFGDFTAVDGLSFEIKTGEFFGLLGPNGAGKTTTISMLSTVLLPSSGEIFIDGTKLTRAASEQKRKLMICRALLIEPEILLLDEPTAGMDALSRRQMWNLLKQVNNRDMTILLTTHYIEEAEALCDRVAMINRGRLQKLDSPQALIRELGEFTVDETGEGDLKSSHFATREEAIRYLENTGSGSVLRQTTLEDVFIDVAGRKLQ